jgi:hypothetical protein
MVDDNPGDRLRLCEPEVDGDAAAVIAPSLLYQEARLPAQEPAPARNSVAAAASTLRHCGKQAKRDFVNPSCRVAVIPSYSLPGGWVSSSLRFRLAVALADS